MELDDSLLNWLLETPLQTILNDITGVLKKNSGHAVHIALELLLRAQISTQDEAIIQIFRILERKFEPHPLITYKTIDNKLILIEAIPRLIGNTREETDLLVKNFKDWIQQDHTIIIPFIGAFSEIPLNEIQKKKVNKIILDSLRSIQDSDIPVVIRTLMKTMNKNSGDEIVKAIQEQCRFLSDDINILIIEVLSTTFSLNALACEFFVKILRHTQEYSSFDLIIMFLLLQKRYKKDMLLVFKHAFQNGTLSRNLISTVESKTLQQYLAPSIYVLCIYLLKEDSMSKNSLVTQFFISVFKYYDSIRLNLVTSIISSLNIGSVGGSILISLSKDTQCSELLSRYGSIIEDFLHNTQTLSDDNIRSLAVSICNCSKANPSILGTLAIFIRKTLFSGQSFDNKIGVVTTSHALNSSVFTQDDIDRFFEWTFALFDENLANELNYHILNLYDLNIERFDQDKSRLILGHLNNMIQKFCLIVRDEDSDKISFNFSEYQDSMVYNSYNESFLTKLISCWLKYQIKTSKSLKGYFKALDFDFDVTMDEKHHINMVCVCSAILNVFDPANITTESTIGDNLAKIMSIYLKWSFKSPFDGKCKIKLEVVSYLLGNSSKIDVPDIVPKSYYQNRLLKTIYDDLKISYSVTKTDTSSKKDFERKILVLKVTKAWDWISQNLEQQQDEISSYCIRILSICLSWLQPNANQVKEFLNLTFKKTEKETISLLMDKFDECLSLNHAIAFFELIYAIAPQNLDLLGKLSLEIIRSDYSDREINEAFVLENVIFAHPEFKEHFKTNFSKLLFMPWMFLSVDLADLYLYDLMYSLKEYSFNEERKEVHDKYKFLATDQVDDFSETIFNMIQFYIKLSRADLKGDLFIIEEPLKMLTLFLKVIYGGKLLTTRFIKVMTTLLGILERKFDDNMNLRVSMSLKSCDFEDLVGSFCKIYSNLSSLCENVKLDLKKNTYQDEVNLRPSMVKLWVRTSELHLFVTETAKENQIEITGFDRIETVRLEKKNFKLLDQKDDCKMTMFQFLIQKGISTYDVDDDEAGDEDLEDQSNEEDSEDDDDEEEFVIRPATKRKFEEESQEDSEEE